MVLHKRAVKSYYQRYIRAPFNVPYVTVRKIVLFFTCDLLKKPGTSEAAWKTAHKGLTRAHIMDVSMAKVQT